MKSAVDWSGISVQPSPIFNCQPSQLLNNSTYLHIKGYFYPCGCGRSFFISMKEIQNNVREIKRQKMEKNIIYIYTERYKNRIIDGKKINRQAKKMDMQILIDRYIWREIQSKQTTYSSSSKRIAQVLPSLGRLAQVNLLTTSLRLPYKMYTYIHCFQTKATVLQFLVRLLYCVLIWSSLRRLLINFI